jgi:hypothetical protein
MRFGKAEGVGGGFGSIAETVPDFALLVLSRGRKGSTFASLPPTSTIDRLGFGKAAQIPEVAVEAIGVVRVAVAQTLWRGRDDGDAVTEAVESPAGGGWNRAGDAWVYASSLSSSARRSGVPTSTQRPRCRSPVMIRRAMPSSSSGRSFITAPRVTVAKNSGQKTPMPA